MRIALVKFSVYKHSVQQLRIRAVGQLITWGCLLSLTMVGCLQEEVISSDDPNAESQAGVPITVDMGDETRSSGDSGVDLMEGDMSGGSRDPERDQGPSISSDMSPRDMSLSMDMMVPPYDFELDGAVDPDAGEPLLDMALDQAVSLDQSLPLPPAECGIQISLNSPVNESFHHQLSPPLVSGVIIDAEGRPVSGATVSLYDQFEGTLAHLDTGIEGGFSLDLGPLQLPIGIQEIELRVRVGEQPCLETHQVSFYLCGRRVDEDFDELPMDWSLVGDATWDPRGWLEMTGIESGRGGAAYNDSENIQSGLASLEFILSTGGGINGGADGFAFSIAELENSQALLDLINAANNGGGLGYAVSGTHAEPDYTLPGEMLTVEIDTWYNRPGGNRHSDPTSQNHLAITRNGDPGDHIAWFEVAQIEDLLPHTVRVEFIPGSMRIFFDGTLAIEQDITFTFKGGYMFFSGSTGYATNYHRFDHLKILHECQ